MRLLQAEAPASPARLARQRLECHFTFMVKHRILFVCLGNICRSPMAEGVFRRVAEEEGALQGTLEVRSNRRGNNAAES